MKQRLLSLCIILIFSLISILSCNSLKEPEAEKGVLNLSAWDFKIKGPVYIDGEWEFYWKEFIPSEYFKANNSYTRNYIKVPSPWNSIPQTNKNAKSFGYGTYRLQIILPVHYNSILALRIPEIYSAYTLYANGEPIIEKG